MDPSYVTAFGSPIFDSLTRLPLPRDVHHGLAKDNIPVTWILSICFEVNVDYAKHYKAFKFFNEHRAEMTEIFARQLTKRCLETNPKNASKSKHNAHNWHRFMLPGNLPQLDFYSVVDRFAFRYLKKNTKENVKSAERRMYRALRNMTDTEELKKIIRINFTLCRMSIRYKC